MLYLPYYEHYTDRRNTRQPPGCFEMPLQVPTGKARVEMKVIPFVKKDAKPDNDGKISMTGREPENTPTPISDSLVGLLAGMGDIDLDEIRMERLAKHLK